MSPVSIGIMVVAGIGMLVGMSKQKGGAAWGKPLAVVCIVVALATAFMSIVKTSTGGNQAGIVEREMQYQKVGAKKLGTYLAEKHGNSKALIIVEPKVGVAADKPNIIVEGLKEGFGGSITVVAEESPTVPESATKAFAAEMPMEGEDMEGEMLPPLEYWFSAKLMDELLSKYSGQYDMIVSTIGLPQDAGRLSIWKAKDKPKVALASGSVYELKGAIKSGSIVAAVTYNPKAEYDDKAVPKNLDEAFNKRFLLLTPDTIDQTASQHPDIFAK